LFGTAHGYLLPLDTLAKALAGQPAVISAKTAAEPFTIGYGPIARADGLAVPADAADLARRRLGPLVARMTGDHGFEVAP
jgi:hypothetical protein